MRVFYYSLIFCYWRERKRTQTKLNSFRVTKFVYIFPFTFAFSSFFDELRFLCSHMSKLNGKIIIQFAVFWEVEHIIYSFTTNANIWLVCELAIFDCNYKYCHFKAQKYRKTNAYCSQSAVATNGNGSRMCDENDENGEHKRFTRLFI